MYIDTMCESWFSQITNILFQIPRWSEIDVLGVFLVVAMQRTSTAFWETVGKILETISVSQITLKNTSWISV